MFVISALELRKNLGDIFQKVATGQEIIVKYRNNTKIKLSPYSTKKPKKVKTQVQKLFDYLDSQKHTKVLANLANNPLLDEKNPAQEKMNIRNSKVLKYLY